MPEALGTVPFVVPAPEGNALQCSAKSNAHLLCFVVSFFTSSKRSLNSMDVAPQDKQLPVLLPLRVLLHLK